MSDGVDIARFAAAAFDVPGQAAWRARVGGRYLLTAGGLAPEQGALDLLEAHATMVQEQAALADVRVVITGDDADADHVPAFMERAEELGAAPIVLGPVPEAEFPSLVAGASAYCYLPIRETSCVGPVEALAAGVPVIARNLPKAREILQDVVGYGDTVLSIADALVDVLTDPPEPEPGVALAMSYA
jgi:glycosyltransferase involved in cell wall biosynthesis